MNEEYGLSCDEAKVKYYADIVEDLKVLNPSQWYSKLKRMSSHDQAKSTEPNVQSFMGISDQNQADSAGYKMSMSP